MKAVPILALALSACATTAQMEASPPAAVYQSAKPRSAIADCLLNRVTAPELTPSTDSAGNVTTVSFTSAGAAIKPPPAVYVFTIRDAGSGSTVEAHRLGHASLAAAETCF